MLGQKRSTYGTVQSLYSHIPYEVCRNFGHSGNDCLETHEDTGTRTTGSVHKEILGGVSRTHDIRKVTQLTIQINPP
jgi:hypothetical protein